MLDAQIAHKSRGWPAQGCQPVLHARRGLKETTGIVGVEVDPEARANLLAASQSVLAAVKEKIPAEAQYRLNVEATFEHWIEQVRIAGHSQCTQLREACMPACSAASAKGA